MAAGPAPAPGLPSRQPPSRPRCHHPVWGPNEPSELSTRDTSRRCRAGIVRAWGVVVRVSHRPVCFDIQLHERGGSLRDDSIWARWTAGTLILLPIPLVLARLAADQPAHSASFAEWLTA